MSSPSAERLAEAVKARRAQLGLNQLDIAARGGPSNSKMTEIEGARDDTLTPATARKLDEGLRWESGSARTVWDGLGDPIPLTRVGQLRRMIAAVESMKAPAEDRAHIIRRLREELDDALADERLERGAS